MTTKLEQLRKQADRSNIQPEMGDLNNQGVTKGQFYLETVLLLLVAVFGGFAVYRGHSIGWLLVLFGLAMGVGGFIYDKFNRD